MNKAIRSDIVLAGVKIRGYKLPSNEWVLSLNSMGKVLGKANTTPMRWVKSDWVKSRLGETFTPMRFNTDNNEEFLAVTIPIFNLFIQYWSFKGDKKAQDLSLALMNQSLELRLEASLPEDKSLKEQVHKVTNKYLDVQSERERQKLNQIQNYFQMWCEAKGMNPAYVHDYITTSVIGRKAKDSRELPLYSGINFYVGLDHYQENENEEMSLISQIKDKLPKKFPRKKKDYNYKNYVDDVIEELAV